MLFKHSLVVSQSALIQHWIITSIIVVTMFYRILASHKRRSCWKCSN